MEVCPKEKGTVSDMQIDAVRREHETILARLMRGPSDGENAMYEAEKIFGLPYWLQANLRHKRRATDKFLQHVHGAYLAALEWSVRRDLEKLREVAGDAETPTVARLNAEAEGILDDIHHSMGRK